MLDVMLVTAETYLKTDVWNNNKMTPYFVAIFSGFVLVAVMVYV